MLPCVFPVVACELIIAEQESVASVARVSDVASVASVNDVSKLHVCFLNIFLRVYDTY